MEFWGVEVKSGEPLKVTPGDGMVLHLSQACLGELKKGKGNESVCLFVNIDEKKLVLGTLSTEKLPQQQFDLVFEKDFELTHNWKNGSVYFYGYRANNPYEDELSGGESDESESEEDIPLTLANNGKPEAKHKQEKPLEVEKSNAAKSKESGSGKQKVKIVEPSKDVKEEDDESSDEDLMSEDSDEDGLEDEDDSESDESDEETPKKVEPRKKRAAESATKTPAADKKAKATPQKTDGKKVSGHVATPHPAKQAGKKTPASKPNQQTPKSGGSHTCKSCNKGFGSDKALESHSKAKHGGD